MWEKVLLIHDAKIKILYVTSKNSQSNEKGREGEERQGEYRGVDALIKASKAEYCGEARRR